MLNVLSWNCRANGQQRKSKWTKSKSWRLHAWFCRWLTSSCAHTLFGHIKYMSVCQKRNDCRLACIGVRCWHSGKSAHFSWCSIFMFGSVVCCMGIGRNEARQGRCVRVAWDRDIDRCMQSLASVRRMQSVQCNKNSAAMRKKNMYIEPERMAAFLQGCSNLWTNILHCSALKTFGISGSCCR